MAILHDIHIGLDRYLYRVDQSRGMTLLPVCRPDDRRFESHRWALVRFRPMGNVQPALKTSIKVSYADS